MKYGRTCAYKHNNTHRAFAPKSTSPTKQVNINKRSHQEVNAEDFDLHPPSNLLGNSPKQKIEGIISHPPSNLPNNPPDPKIGIGDMRNHLYEGFCLTIATICLILGAFSGHVVLNDWAHDLLFLMFANRFNLPGNMKDIVGALLQAFMKNWHL